MCLNVVDLEMFAGFLLESFHPWLGCWGGRRWSDPRESSRWIVPGSFWCNFPENILDVVVLLLWGKFLSWTANRSKESFRWRSFAAQDLKFKLPVVGVRMCFWLFVVAAAAILSLRNSIAALSLVKRRNFWIYAANFIIICKRKQRRSEAKAWKKEVQSEKEENL